MKVNKFHGEENGKGEPKYDTCDLSFHTQEEDARHINDSSEISLSIIST